MSPCESEIWTVKKEKVRQTRPGVLKCGYGTKNSKSH